MMSKYLLLHALLLAPSNAFQPAIPIYAKRRTKLHAATINTPPQLIEFKEPKTNTTVILIGTMHYNPTSISTVKSTIQSLASQNSLASVIVESCDIRWNTTTELLKTPRGKIFEPVLMSEMKAASDIAMEYNIPCILGDQRINATGDSLGSTFKETFVGLVNPKEWGNMYREFTEKAEIALPSGDGYLNARSILDPRLLIAAPVSFAKYPLSFLARNPISTSIVFGFLGALTVLDSANAGGTSFMDSTLQEQALSLFSSLLFAGLEFSVFARIMVQVLLYERNEILARNILHQCKLSSGNGKKNVSKGSGNAITDMLSFFSGSADDDAASVTEELKGTTGTDAFETFYVPGGTASVQVINTADTGKVVLAVLGMAHCNGIVKLLKEELVD
eukprot:scaffold187_cov266-Chaetoceros_neogracile.AAC.59